MSVLHRKEDIEVIKENLDKIIKDAEHKQVTILEPNMEEYRSIIKVILQFIKDHNRIIYGGWSLNELIKNKDKSKAVYDEYDKADLEFYSPEPMKDLIDLADILYKNKFKYVTAKQAQHEETYTIFVNFENYCDISYVPRNVYNNMPNIQLDGYRYIHPDFKFIDELRVYNNPLTAYRVLDKTFKRSILLKSLYPFKNINELKKIEPSVDKKMEDILEFVRKEIIATRETFISIGFYAYYYYLSQANEKEPINLNIPFYDVISIDIKKDSVEIINLLKEKYHDKITVEEYWPFFQFLDHSVVIKYDDKPILNIYGNNDICIPFKYLDKKKIKIGTFKVVLMYLFMFAMRAYINHDKQIYHMYQYMAINLLDKRSKYLTKHNKTVLDDTPFQDFQIDCVGHTIDPGRAFRLSGITRREKGKPFQYSYDPANKPVDFKYPEYVFNNSSGNIINNPMNKFFKPEGYEIRKKDKKIEDISESSTSESDEPITSETESEEEKYKFEQNGGNFILQKWPPEIGKSIIIKSPNESNFFNGTVKDLVKDKTAAIIELTKDKIYIEKSLYNLPQYNNGYGYFLLLPNYYWSYDKNEQPDLKQIVQANYHNFIENIEKY